MAVSLDENYEPPVLTNDLFTMPETRNCTAMTTSSERGAFIILETQEQGLGDGKLLLSGTNQVHLVDLAVFGGKLRGLEGLPDPTHVVE